MNRVVYQGQALPATQPIPPNLPGHDDNWNVGVQYDPAAANALLDRFRYRGRDGDGYRELPDGKPLKIVMASAPSSRDREFDELWQKSMKAVGIRIEFFKSKFPDLIEMGKAGQLQMWRVGWITLYGEGDAFAQLLYGPNIGQTNYARFSLHEYDDLYRASRRPDGPERNKLYRRMSELVAAYTRGGSASTRSRTRSSSRGCWVTRSTPIGSIRGSISTSTLPGSKPRASAGSW